MSTPERSSQLFANAMMAALLYIPKGIVYPIAYFIDFIKTVRFQKNIACAFCEDHALVVQKNWLRYFQQFFRRVQHFFEPFFLFIARFNLALMNSLTPASWLARLQPYFRQLWKKRRYLYDNRVKIVWKTILPLSLLMTMPYFFGLSIIPEIYIFFLASSWAGKILNFCANILVRRGQSAEWGFVKSLILVLLKKRTLSRVYEDYREALLAFSKEVCFDLLVIGMLQRASTFMSYCFQAFFSWLLLYILVKTTADEAPSMLQTLEDYLNEKQQEESQSYKHQLGNGLWIALYYTFQETSSTPAQTHYRSLHQASHQAPILLDCAQRQGSNLNSSQDRLSM